ncbi:MAG: hypothetical protein ACRENS_06610 [Candidatus Eiseniibacteriota bacterium]
MDDSQREREIRSQVGAVLRRDWDPIGVADDPQGATEYHSFVAGVHGLIVSGASAHEIAQHLGMIEETQLGLRRRTHADLLPVARKLQAIPARVNRGESLDAPRSEPERRLYSLRQIGAAALFGSPMAGCYLLAENFRAFGRPEAGKQALLLGAVATALLIASTFYVASVLLTFEFAACATALHLIAKRTQGAAVAAHLAAGGAGRSNGRVVWISIAWTLIVAVVFVIVTLIVPYHE